MLLNRRVDWQGGPPYTCSICTPGVQGQALAGAGAGLVDTGTLRALAAKRALLKRDRSVPLGRAKPKLISEMVFSHVVSPSGPATVTCEDNTLPVRPGGYNCIQECLPCHRKQATLQRGPQYSLCHGADHGAQRQRTAHMSSSIQMMQGQNAIVARKSIQDVHSTYLLLG